MRATETTVSATDRLGFTLFVALVIHAVMILGVAFDPELRPRIQQTLEVTLASFESDKAPEEADFIAQHNQQGSGDLTERTPPSSLQEAVFQENEIKPLAAEVQPQPAPVSELTPQPVPPAPAEREEVRPDPRPVSKPRELVTTVSENTEPVAEATRAEQDAGAPPSAGLATALLARSLEIAALEAKLDVYSQTRTRAPRVRRLYSASTRESYDAAYLDAWRRKVERIGNLNYPEEAHRRRLYGSLRLLTVVRADGTLERVEILKSSGHRVLDDAARRIVHLAAPFAPFPPELRKQADLVEIIRTWKFEPARFGVNG